MGKYVMKGKIREYLLKLAKEYEKHGFLLPAADVYRRVDPRKVKALYEKIARKCERFGLYSLAVEAYENAGMIEKSKKCWERLAKALKGKGFRGWAIEAFEKAGCLKEAKN
jgi:tetratricopeptide (TPR) repeat protein